jgi:hypothetical protein
MGSAFTDGVRVNIRKAHSTISIFDMEFSVENITGSMEESRGCQKYKNREETVNGKREKCKREKGNEHHLGRKSLGAISRPSPIEN